MAVAIDVTTSMVESQNRLGIVQRFIPDAIRRLPVSNVDLIWFNHCQDVNAERMEKDAAAQRVAQFDPKALQAETQGRNQSAPLALSVRRAIERMQIGPDGQKTGRVILITDTYDECDRAAACQSARAIKIANPKVRINLIALDTKAMEVACFANETGGQVWQQGDGDPSSLVQALEAAGRLPFCE